MAILDELHANREKRSRIAAQQKAADMELQILIRMAFADGETGPAIAAAAALSVPRTYQIRDGRR